MSEVIWGSRCTGGLLCWGSRGEGWDGGTDSDGGISTDPSSRSERGMVFCRPSVNPTRFSCGNAHACIANLDLCVLGFFKLPFTNTPEIIHRCLLITVWKLLFSSHLKVAFLGKSLANFVSVSLIRGTTHQRTWDWSAPVIGKELPFLTALRFVSVFCVIYSWRGSIATHQNGKSITCISSGKKLKLNCWNCFCLCKASLELCLCA